MNFVEPSDDIEIRDDVVEAWALQQGAGVTFEIWRILMRSTFGVSLDVQSFELAMCNWERDPTQSPIMNVILDHEYTATARELKKVAA